MKANRKTVSVWVARPINAAVLAAGVWVAGGETDEVPGVVAPAVDAAAAFTVAAAIAAVDLWLLRPGAKDEQRARKAVKHVKNNPPS
jgi:phosphoribosylaminoimidazole (AIR) synthetase